MSARPTRPTGRLTTLLAALLAGGAAAPAAAAQEGQPLAARVAAARDGDVAVRYVTRSGVCGDGRDVLALGRFMTTGDGWTNVDGWSDVRCVAGPARLVLTVRGGAVTAVRLSVGGAADAQPAAAAVPAAQAAAYALDLARRLGGTSGARAVAAAAVADSADVWRPLLALARGGAPDERARNAAMHWLTAVAPPAAVPEVAALVRDEREPRKIRESGLAVLTLIADDAGVPTVMQLARGGSDGWLREKAVFWLGQTDAEPAHALLRTLASSDAEPADVREQAIFALGVGRRADADVAFLRELYPRLAEGRLRKKVIFAVAQADDAASRRWLLDLATSSSEPVEARKEALFWAGQQRDASVADLIAVYPRLSGSELRRHYTFVLSQRSEDAALDRLLDVAAHDADRDVRKQAIFWLGQSRNPRAQRYLTELIDR